VGKLLAPNIEVPWARLSLFTAELMVVAKSGAKQTFPSLRCQPVRHHLWGETPSCCAGFRCLPVRRFLGRCSLGEAPGFGLSG